MDKQRTEYRNLILKLFKENFDSAMFVEKRDDMLKESDFEIIRNEIEEEYFIKNRGIAPYITAIKYLRAKIEACTVAKTLFIAVEDYISAKDNIVITKIATVAPPEPAKKLKRTEQQPKGKSIEPLQAHADCKPPHPCKKCRIMCRQPDVGAAPKPRKQRPKKTKVAVAKKGKSKTAKSPPQYSDISDSEATLSSSSTNSTTTESIPSTTSTTTTVKNEQLPIYQLPYSDHQYSRISFYGSGMVEDSDKTADEAETKPKKNSHQTKANTSSVSKVNKHPIVENLLKSKQTVIKPVPKLLPTNLPYRLNSNNGVRQPAPQVCIQQRCIMQRSISTTTSTVSTMIQPPTPTVIRPIPRPIGYPLPRPSVFVTAPTPMSFNAPVAMFQGSVIRQPVYYIRFCEPQPTRPHPYYPNNFS